jgi:hypothetical protein
MPLLLAVTLAAAMQPACSWDNPGHNPYTGSTAAAIDRYTDIPEAVRRTLKRRIEEGKPDDKVSITRDGIAGAQQYDPIIRGMHFGSASMCGEVTRRKWAEARVEPGVVYCAEQHCILVPKICGNVSRISRAGDRMVSLPSREARALSDEDEFADVGLVPPERGPNPHAIEHLEDMDAEDMLRLLDRAIREMLAERLAAGDDYLDDDKSEQARARERDARFGSGRNGNGKGEDEVLAAVPEADTWAMLVGGLGMIGWIARRRRTGPFNPA